jgi:polysaccharide export outer membrane protein
MPNCIKPRVRLIVALLLMMLSCATAQLRPATGSGAGASADLYRLRTHDSISVQVFDEPDLAAQQTVDTRGQIKLPLLGIIDVRGLTLREVEQRIEDAYTQQRFLREPAVTVFITSHAPREVIVLGEVRRTGPLALPMLEDSIDIIELVARAGGFTGIAKQSAVSIKREQADGTVREFIIDVETLIEDRRDGKPMRTFQVRPGDVIFVPERLF